MKFAEKLFLKDIRTLARIVLYFFLILGVIIFLLHGLIVLGFRYPLDYGEGPLLNQALRVAEGEALYPSEIAAPPYLISNYPPIFLLINALLTLLFGPSLAPGRLISFISTLGAAGMIAMIIRHFSKRKDLLPLLAGASAFLITPYVLEWSPLYRIDMLGLFLSLFGLVVLVWGPHKTRNIIIAAGLFIMAAYTRQSYGLATPLAGIVFTLTKDKRQALRLFLIYVLGGLAIFGLLFWLTDGAFFFHIITANVNPFHWETVWNFAQDVQRKMPIILLLAGGYLVFGWRLTKTYALLSPYLLASALAALTIGKVGSNINYLVEISAAFGLLIGIAFSRLNETLPLDPDQKPDLNFPDDIIPDPEPVQNTVKVKLWINLIIFLILSGGIIFQVARFSQDSLFGPISNHRDRIKQPGNDYAFLEARIRTASADGPVLADEYMAMLPMNHIPVFGIKRRSLTKSGGRNSH